MSNYTDEQTLRDYLFAGGSSDAEGVKAGNTISALLSGKCTDKLASKVSRAQIKRYLEKTEGWTFRGQCGKLIFWEHDADHERGYEVAAIYAEEEGKMPFYSKLSAINNIAIGEKKGGLEVWLSIVTQEV